MQSLQAHAEEVYSWALRAKRRPSSIVHLK